METMVKIKVRNIKLDPVTVNSTTKKQETKKKCVTSNVK